jgi:hypothetical protein
MALVPPHFMQEIHATPPSKLQPLCHIRLSPLFISAILPIPSKDWMSTMEAPPSRPRVFLDVSIGTEPIGRLVIELFADKAPKTVEK